MPMKNFIQKCIPFQIIFGFALMLLGCNSNSGNFAQYDEKFQADLRNSGMVHRPLPTDYSKAYETFGLTKKVLVSEVLCDMEDFGKWSHTGIGSMHQTSERKISGNNSLRLIAPTRIPETTWIQGMPRVDDVFWGLGLGASRATFDVGGANWEKYNRLHFYIYPDVEGARSICLQMYIYNDGEIKAPDIYGREGYHQINLKNRQWNECFLEITELARDKVTALIFESETFGKELAMGDFLQFDIDDVKLQVI